MLAAIVSTLADRDGRRRRPGPGARLRARRLRRAVLDLVPAAPHLGTDLRSAGAARVWPRPRLIMAGVRMGEMVVSADPADELVALGLGSCIGLAIVDRPARVAGLAHIVLPESRDKTEPARQVRRHRRAGADRAAAQRRRRRAPAGGGDRRRRADVRDERRARHRPAQRDRPSAPRWPGPASRCAPRETGGNQGRTVRIAVGDGRVTVRVAGQPAVTVLEGKVRRGGGGGAIRVPSAPRIGATPPTGGSTRGPRLTGGAIRGPRAALGIGAWR